MVSSILMREILPDRRKTWTQKVKIGGQTVYLSVGEYEDGRPGDIFIDIAKAGTFARGMLGTLARTVSIALQCGAGVEVITHMLRGHDYEPRGVVQGSDTVRECQSVADWVASELEAKYMGDAMRG